MVFDPEAELKTLAIELSVVKHRLRNASPEGQTELLRQQAEISRDIRRNQLILKDRAQFAAQGKAP